MALSEKDIHHLSLAAGSSAVLRSEADRFTYAYDSATGTYLPDLVILPETREQVAAILEIATQRGIPVVPRGAGSGTTGGAVATCGGVVLAMTRMNQIREIDTDNLTADAEPGVLTGQLHAAVEAKGLFYPPDPSSAAFSTLGGNLGECAGGPRAVKYGVTRDYVLGLEAVLPTGEIIHTGVRTAKGVVGYDLTRLIVGSEGTLAVITAMTLKLLPLPESVRTAMAVFADMQDAAKTVSALIRNRVVPRCIEYMDRAAIGCAEAQAGIGLPVDAGALLILEVDGSTAETGAALDRIHTICKTRRCRRFDVAADETARKDLWQARKSLSQALFAYGPHKINEDIVVPRSRIPDMVARIEALRQETGLTMVSFGHAGDGNIHFNIMLDKTDPVAAKKAEQAVKTVFAYTLELGGTLSGEHGVGITKAPFFDMEISPASMRLMKRVKAAFDPQGILNPGKMFQR
ncbi:MAG: glycolate oxidase subunit GlcD [Deltaproteobacteria bacterium]|nr:MAG: glycolate oxidase subunit GlcD [Deltaproteobacteria bacterium]